MKLCSIVAILMLVVVVGCASLPAGPGDGADSAPPKLKIGSDNAKTWDRPDAFGPVPPALQAIADEECGPAMKAVGYHPHAQDENGNELIFGGYLCVPRR